MAKEPGVRKTRNLMDDGAEVSRDESVPTGNGSEKGAAGPEDVEGLREELRVLNTKWMRALADLDNYKKRVQRERGRWVVEAREDILLSLLEVVDDLERAVAGGDDSGTPADDPFRAGVELILQRLHGVLAKNGVTPIDTRGADFDPTVHEAVAHVESDGHESDKVVEEVGRGYMVGDRVLRHSRVVVAK
ncbi:MAG: nucleotide exchange factor GrpE [Candidatus Eisenbacteria bacterium]